MKKIAMLAALVIGAAIPLRAAPLSSTEVLDRLSTAENRLLSVKFSFTQSIQFKQMGQTASVEGEALFAKSGRFRIRKNPPNEQITFSDGRTLWMYSPDNKQAWKGNWTQWSRSSVLPKGLLPLSNYVGELKKDFEVTVDSAAAMDAPELRILAMPKDVALGYRLEIWVSTVSWLPVKTIFDSDSARVATTLSHVEENPDVSDAVFHFSVPKGTEVISLN